MSERYNFVTENIDDFKKATALDIDLGEFCNNVMVHEFKRIGIHLEDGKALDASTEAYFITGQSIEVDSNAGCYELRGCLTDAKIAAVFINCPTETGTIYCGCKNGKALGWIKMEMKFDNCCPPHWTQNNYRIEHLISFIPMTNDLAPLLNLPK